MNFPGKDRRLVVIGKRPLVAETPEHLLDDETTPIEKFYVRSHGRIPQAAADPDKWKIRIDGEVENELELTLDELKSKFKPVTLRMVLECGGNGRAFFTPRTSGNQWTHGGVGCAEWTGVRLRDVLRSAGLKRSAVYTAHYGADAHPSGDPKRAPLSRGVRIAKALEPHSLIVWGMNGRPLPTIHGGPVRLIIPGWTASASQKWLTRIRLRDREHDGSGMTGTDYRVPVAPIVPGSKASRKNFRVLEEMPVRSIVTSPANGARLAAGTRKLNLRGAAWAGDLSVRRVEVSTDHGSSWRRARLSAPKNRYDWQRWTASVPLPSDGYFEIWTRATDASGKTQPYAPSNWNPNGYGGNAFHRIKIVVG